MKRLLPMVGFFSLLFAQQILAEEPLEQLLGVSVDETGITFQVTSNGCTSREDFHFQVEEVLQEMSPMLPAYEHHYYITVTRVRPDLCEVFLPYGARVTLTFEELGIQFGKFHVTNPIGGDKILN